MSRARRRGAAFVLATLGASALAMGDLPRHALHAPLARAATPLPKGVQLDAATDASEVGVGGLVQYSITISTTVSGLRVTGLSPGKMPGFVLVGGPFQSISSFSSQQGWGGPVVEVNKLTATWQLRAKDVGEHLLGPGELQIGTTKYTTPAVKVTVLAPGARATPKTMPTVPGWPGRVPPAPPSDDEPADSPVPDRFEPTDPAAKLDAAPTDPGERQIFTRLVAVPKSPVIGEQIVTKLFVYARVSARVGDDPQARNYPDFATHPIPEFDHQAHRITLGDETWSYKQMQETAAFPLKTGTLTIGAVDLDVEIGLRGQRIKSPPLTIEVREPPNEGRPTDYVLGDVASDLTIESEVAPRETSDGHAVLTVRMAGAGRIEQLEPKLPAIAGATLRRTSDAGKSELRGARVVGTRTLTYDLSATRAGEIGLGDVRAVVWDPARSSYVTVRSPLGTLKATKAAEMTAAATGSAEAKLDLPGPRLEAGPRGDGTTLADRGWTWGVIASAPLLVLAAQGTARALGAARKRGAKRREDPQVQAKAALKAARASERAGDAKGAAGACIRAIELAVEAATGGGVRARGMTSSELRARLADEGMDGALAERVADATGALQAARFAGEQGPSVEAIDALVRAVGAFGDTLAERRAP
jgi:hypothetical protein